MNHFSSICQSSGTTGLHFGLGSLAIQVPSTEDLTNHLPFRCKPEAVLALPTENILEAISRALSNWPEDGHKGVTSPEVYFPLSVKTPPDDASIYDSFPGRGSSSQKI